LSHGPATSSGEYQMQYKTVHFIVQQVKTHYLGKLYLDILIQMKNSLLLSMFNLSLCLSNLEREKAPERERVEYMAVFLTPQCTIHYAS
jgi:hypothetical protein